LSVRATWLLLLAGCYRPAAAPPCAVDPDAEGCTPDDGASDTMPDSSFTCEGGRLHGTSIVQICIPDTAIVPPSFPLDGDFNSTDPASCNQTPTIEGVEVCVLWAETITIGQGGVIGSRPVVLVATDTLTISTGGLLNASSSSDGTRVGAGATLNDCAGSAGSGDIGGGGGSGGAGGWFEGDAGNGGQGGNSQAGGTVVGPTPLAFRPGCRGGTGRGDPGNGGRAGGAVFLIAGARIVISAGSVINASGGGGQAAAMQSGGAGGGSGGFVGLDAPVIIVDGVIFALGGGGSPGGGINNAGGSGKSALGPQTVAAATAGVNNCQGTGGAGGGRDAAGSPGGTGTNECGGGGGGGSVGVIGFANGEVNDETTRFAPAPQMLP
jgi:hypothetical protein